MPRDPSLEDRVRAGASPARATLVLGGARSGKSRRALTLARPWSRRTLVATAEALDAEMAERIARHRRERDASWTVVETSTEVPAALDEHAGDGGVAVVDCLTLWLSNLMHRGRDVERETASLVDAIAAAGAVVLVSNEVGLGLVPDNPLGRAFRDAQGRLNQRVAAACDRVEFVAAGLPLVLKGE